MPNETYSPTLDVIRAEKEADRMAERKNVDFLPIKRAIYSNVSDKFDCCTLDTAKAFNDLLVRYFSKKQPTEDIDLQALRDTVDRIYINKCGTVKMLLNKAERLWTVKIRHG